ncbi:TniQ family protein [Mycolicibacterium sp. ELW1]|uniref:TniQ family protein n=1 Tax=unclassified Mycolicibacterium TaxID=2636767 RepID=UPI003D7812DB
MDALASRHGVTVIDIMQFLNIDPRATRGAAWAEAEADHLALTAGVPRDEIRAMTWQHLTATGTTISGGVTLPVHTFVQPVSRFCPHCLSGTGGRWKLSWRLRAAIACPIHGCLLAEVCPRCRSPQRRHPAYRNCVPHLGHCANRVHHGRDNQPCDYDLCHTTVKYLPRNHVLLIAQRRLDAMIGPPRSPLPIYGADRPPAAAILYDIGFLADLLVAAAPTQTLLGYAVRCWSNTPECPLPVSASIPRGILAVASAVALLSSHNGDQATASMHKICGGALVVASRSFGKGRRSRLTPTVQALTAPIHITGITHKQTPGTARMPVHAAEKVAARTADPSRLCETHNG